MASWKSDPSSLQPGSTADPRALGVGVEEPGAVVPQHHRRIGPDGVAFYGSGQLLTEDYYVANKLAKGFLGTNNFDTNSRLCMASAAAIC